MCARSSRHHEAFAQGALGTAQLFWSWPYGLTERLDCWDFNGQGWGLKLPCIGMFDVNAAGKIYETPDPLLLTFAF